MEKKILILKNDRSGDLFNSLKVIYNILDQNQNEEIHLYLYHLNKPFSYLFEHKNIPVVLKLLSELNLSISFSRSITNFTTTDCTLPADNLTATFFHNNGDNL